MNELEKPINRGTESAKVIEVIKTITVIGEGTTENMVRPLHQYWSLEGKLLAEYDPCTTEFTIKVDESSY